MKLLLCFIFAFIYAVGFAQSTENPGIIPQPVSVSILVGQSNFSSASSLYIDEAVDEYFKQYVIDVIAKSAGIHFSLSTVQTKKSFIRLEIKQNKNPILGKEGYEIKVAANSMVISANETNGLFYGIQTLLQLIDQYSKGSKSTGLFMPNLSIVDYPRFAWRGYMLDVSRHTARCAPSTCSKPAGASPRPG